MSLQDESFYRSEAKKRKLLKSSSHTETKRCRVETHELGDENLEHTQVLNLTQIGLGDHDSEKEDDQSTDVSSNSSNSQIEAAKDDDVQSSNSQIEAAKVDVQSELGQEDDHTRMRLTPTQLNFESIKDENEDDVHETASTQETIVPSAESTPTKSNSAHLLQMSASSRRPIFQPISNPGSEETDDDNLGYWIEYPYISQDMFEDYSDLESSGIEPWQQEEVVYHNEVDNSENDFVPLQPAARRHLFFDEDSLTEE